MELLGYFSLFSVYAFSISATLSTSGKKFDIFGVCFITFITSIGGGTVRDLLLGIHPLFWMENQIIIFTIGLGILTAIIFKKRMLKFKRAFFLFDTIGIGVTTIIGISKALALDVTPILAVVFGLISAVFGGIIRDTLCNEIPLIFRKELYAMTCITGGLTYILLLQFEINEFLTYLIPMLIIIIFRILAIKYKISLPSLTL